MPCGMKDRTRRDVRVPRHEGEPAGEERRKSIEEDVAGAVARFEIWAGVADGGDEEESGGGF